MKSTNVVDMAALALTIEGKKHRLEEARRKLKAHFIGIDHIIDNIIDVISGWYIMPEFMKRPLIVNLWGLTGVGKTDLVRRLVKEIGFFDRYLEVQLGSDVQSSEDDWGPSTRSSLNEMILTSDVMQGEPGVLLLDEVQRFRTIDGDGDEMAQKTFQDVWIMLGDGKFPRTENNLKSRLLSVLLEGPASEFSYFRDEKQKNDKNPYNCTYRNAMFLKRLLKINEKIENIMKWDNNRFKKEVIEKLQDPAVFEGEDYTKLLIFVAGNLDEAFTMAKDIADVDVDADIFHGYSKMIDVLTIKRSLRKRFRPEQISRFGNNHVIYPSLNKLAYETIIDRKLLEITEDSKTRIGVTLNFKPSVRDFIYRNGVFPTQGTRPVFSTISSVVESNIPRIVLAMIEANIKECNILCENDNLIVEHTSTKILEQNLKGCIDDIRKNVKKNHNKGLVTSVHEGAHALVFAQLFNLSPKQIIANSIDSMSDGFILPHNIAMTKDTMENHIKVLLAGLVAEEMIFGPNDRTIGSSEDLKRATSLSADYYRRFAFGEWKYVIASPYVICGEGCENIEPSEAVTNLEDTNSSVQDMMNTLKQDVTKILQSNKNLLKEIVDFLIEKGKMVPEDMKAICSRHGIHVDIVVEDDIIYKGDFENSYKKFIGTHTSSDPRNQEYV